MKKRSRELLLIADGASTSPVIEKLLDGSDAIATRLVLALFMGIVCILAALRFRP